MPVYRPHVKSHYVLPGACDALTYVERKRRGGRAEASGEKRGRVEYLVNKYGAQAVRDLLGQMENESAAKGKKK